MGQNPGASQESPGATHEVRAVPDVRTNSVLCAATEQKLAIIDQLMLEIDRQVNDMLIVKIYELKNADPIQMTTILQALFRPQVQATANAGASNRGGQQNQGGGLMGAMMGFGGPGGSRGSLSGATPGGSLLPSQEVEITNDPRTRSVVVKASREYIAIIDDVVKQLDANPTEQVSTYVYRFKNGDAVNIATSLQNLLKSSQPGAASGFNANPFGQGNRGQNQQVFSGMNAQGFNNFGSSSSFGSGGSGLGGSSFGSGTSFGSGRRNLGPLEGSQDGPTGPPQEEEPRRQIQGPVDLSPDSSTNSIIFRGSPRDFMALQGILQELDRLRPQVLIKCLIADVTLDHSMQFGLQGFWEEDHTIGGKRTTTNLGTAFDLPTQGLLTSITNSDVQGKLNALATQGKLRVLATPRILALDNQTAAIIVGKDVPRITNSTINSFGNPVNSVTYESLGIKLQVTPHINPDGLVTMIVNPEVSDLAPQSEAVPITTGVTSPTFIRNQAQTTVSVRNGTTVILGGLIRETSDDSVQKVPFLGDLPLLGYLFSSTTKKKEKRELMIFLTPYVAFSVGQLEEITELEKSRLKVLDPRDIDAESDRWLERVRH
jgi:general secretion pathway protein D